MPVPVFTTGEVLTAANMNKVGLWKVTPSSAVNGTVSTDGDVTFSGQSSLSINGAFTSDFDHYVIKASIYGSISSFTRWRLRASGTDSTTTNYYRYGFTAIWSGGISAYNGGAETSWTPFGSHGNLEQYAGVTDAIVANPASASYRTTITCEANDPFAGQRYNISGLHELANSYDGFTIFPNGGTISGIVRIYGYRN